MKEIKLFEDAIKELEAINEMPNDEMKHKAEDEFYDSLPGWKYNLLIKYQDAQHRKNQFIDFDDCPSEKEIPELVSCLKECEVTHITISSGWSSLIEKMWVFCQTGCKIEGMIEINGRSKDWETGEYEKRPAFLLAVEEIKE